MSGYTLRSDKSSFTAEDTAPHRHQREQNTCASPHSHQGALVQRNDDAYRSHHHHHHDDYRTSMQPTRYMTPTAPTSETAPQYTTEVDPRTHAQRMYRTDGEGTHEYAYFYNSDNDPRFVEKNTGGAAVASGTESGSPCGRHCAMYCYASSRTSAPGGRDEGSRFFSSTDFLPTGRSPLPFKDRGPAPTRRQVTVEEEPADATNDRYGYNTQEEEEDRDNPAWKQQQKQPIVEEPDDDDDEGMRREGGGHDPRTRYQTRDDPRLRSAIAPLHERVGGRTRERMMAPMMDADPFAMHSRMMSHMMHDMANMEAAFFGSTPATMMMMMPSRVGGFSLGENNAFFSGMPMGHFQRMEQQRRNLLDMNNGFFF